MALDSIEQQGSGQLFLLSNLQDFPLSLKHLEVYIHRIQKFYNLKLKLDLFKKIYQNYIFRAAATAKILFL
jgi:hypothetical protein